jgi:hypothetical protein
MRTSRRRAGAAGAVLILLLAGLGVVGAVGPAAGVAGAQGCPPWMTVSRTDGLDPNGETLTVSGGCFDESKGIYVAFCVVPPPGSVPTPCGGGVDMSGAGGLSHWIDSNPPPQGVGLATPFGEGGTFTVTMRPVSQLNATVDCVRVRCAIVTRADHTRTSDRSQDVIIPVSFAEHAAPPPVFVPPPAFVPPPVTEPAPTQRPVTEPPAEEATTTTAAPETTTTSTTAAADTEELAVTNASDSDDDGGGSGGSAGLVVAVVVAVLAVAGVGGTLLYRRRS